MVQWYKFFGWSRFLMPVELNNTYIVEVTSLTWEIWGYLKVFRSCREGGDSLPADSCSYKLISIRPNVHLVIESFRLRVQCAETQLRRFQAILQQCLRWCYVVCILGTVVRHCVDQTGVVEDPPGIKIGYRPWIPKSALHLCIKVGYSSAMY